MKLRIHSQIWTVVPLKFGNRSVISSNSFNEFIYSSMLYQIKPWCFVPILKDDIFRWFSCQKSLVIWFKFKKYVHVDSIGNNASLIGVNRQAISPLMTHDSLTHICADRPSEVCHWFVWQTSRIWSCHLGHGFSQLRETKSLKHLQELAQTFVYIIHLSVGNCLL